MDADWLESSKAIQSLKALISPPHPSCLFWSFRIRNAFPHCYCVILFPGSVIELALTLVQYETIVWHSIWHPLIQSTVTDCRPWQRFVVYNSLLLIVRDLDVSSSGLLPYFINTMSVRLGYCLISVWSFCPFLGLSLIQLFCSDNVDPVFNVIIHCQP